MRRSDWLLIPGLGLAAISGAALADAPFDGTATLLCALNQAMECSPRAGCEPLQLEDVGAPPFFRIDAAGRTVAPVRAAGDDQRRSEIRGSGQVDGKLILQGFEDGIEDLRDGLGWTIAIAQDTGHFVLSASGDQVAFVVFGACTTADAGTP
jgi:hypothetical protein